MKKWIVLNKKLNIKNKKLGIEDIIKILLENRGLKTKKEINKFLNSSLADLTVENAGINRKELEKSIKRIKKAIVDKEQVIIFGDYDVDGICGSAILWETLNRMDADVLPYIPHRIEEGYGISRIGITNILKKYKKTSLIITVDNGIVANSAVKFAKKKNIDVIITDHHVPSSNLPKAHSIIHTTKLCGAGVAYLLAQELKTNNEKLITGFEHLSLAAIATVADLVPVTGLNRIILKFGLEELRRTKRPGLCALVKEAGLIKENIDVFEIGHILAPRLNAMGRIELAIESLRLLCTKDEKSCESLARRLGATNKRRQDITFSSFEHARLEVLNSNNGNQKLIFIAHKSYQPGVIGLIAGRLMEEFYRPAIVLSLGEEFSKASARSIPGFNIIEFIRSASDLLVDAGGHPMAAGFTVETHKIKELLKRFEETSEKLITKELLKRSVKIDMEIFLEDIGGELYDEVLKIAPFGVGNPQPIFLTKELLVSDMRVVGVDGRHITLRLISPENKPIDVIGFNFANRINEIKIGDRVDVVYSIDREIWNGSVRFKLKLKDFKKIN